MSDGEFAEAEILVPEQYKKEQRGLFFFCPSW
jgi:hypothetical protein